MNTFSLCSMSCIVNPIIKTVGKNRKYSKQCRIGIARYDWIEIMIIIVGILQNEYVGI